MSHPQNPWNGLRTYVEGEIIYGRKEEIQILSLLILQSRQTVVYGRSGIGKSSILNAGIFPLARKHGVFPVYVRFEHNVEVSYLHQIKRAITKEVEKANGQIVVKELVTASADETLWEFFHRYDYADADGNHMRPLIVFDQFEEMFTLETRKDKVDGFFSQMADLINNVMPEEVASTMSATSPSTTAASPDGGLDLGLDAFSQTAFSYKAESDHHMVFTLREDFLSYLERNTTDIPALKNNRYCLQPINDEQAAEIIMQPRPGLVDKAVAKLIIEKVTGDENFEIDGVPEIQVDSAILSLYLSRLYDKMCDEGLDTITKELVETYSDNIIEDFYSDAIRDLPETAVEWLEDTLINEDGRRDNRDRSTVLHDSGLTKKALDNLIYNVKLLRQFSYGGALRIEYIHDVICAVIIERRKQRAENKTIQRLEQKARDEKHKAHKRIATTACIFTIIGGVLLALLYIYYRNNDKLYEACYADVTLINGWPEGVGANLSTAEMKTHPLYYKLSKHGKRTPHYTEMEICSSNSMLPMRPRLDWPEKCDDDDIDGQGFNDILARTKYVKFMAGDSDKISRMDLCDEHGDLLFSYSYYYYSNSGAWVNFLTATGEPSPVRTNGIDRYKVEWDSVGREISRRYYTSNGTIRHIDKKRKIAGYAMQYPDAKTTITHLLNEAGIPSSVDGYNRVTTYRGNDTLITSYHHVRNFDDPRPQDAVGRAGYSRVVSVGNIDQLYLPDCDEAVAQCRVEKDQNGNDTLQEIIGCQSLKVAPIIKWKYKGDTGLEIKKVKLNADGSRFGQPSDVYLLIKDYNDAGRLIMEKRITVDGDTIYSYSLTEGTTPNHLKVTSASIIDRVRGLCFTEVDTIASDNSLSIRAFYGPNGVAVNHKIPFDYDSISCHLVRTHVTDSCIISEHYIATADGQVVPAPTSMQNYLYTSFKLTTWEEGENKFTELQSADGQIVKRMLYIYNNGQQIGRAACSIIDNKPVRCPNWEIDGAAYYTIYFAKDFVGNYCVLEPHDEWGNSGVFDFLGSYKKLEYRDFNGEKLADGFTVTSSYWQQVFNDDPNVTHRQVPYLHVLSLQSALRRTATPLTDGDRIISLGTWRYGQDTSLLAREWRNLSDANKTVAITVLRPGESGYTRISTEVAGDPAEASRSEYHVMKLSKQELSTLNNALK